MRRNYTGMPYDKRFEVRLPYEEYLDWKDAADLLNVSIAEYVRSMVRKGRIDLVVKNEVELSGIREIIAQYGKIGSNINQIARSLNEGYPWSDSLRFYLKKQLADLDAMHRMLMEAVRKFNGNTKTYRQPQWPVQ